MMPCVFAASCMPWPTAIAVAEMLCAVRNPRFSRCGWPLRKIHSTDSITAKPRIAPTMGDTTIGITILLDDRPPVDRAVRGETEPPRPGRRTARARTRTADRSTR